jgi:glycosyltransferase involved in cell wall biosynthesis
VTGLNRRLMLVVPSATSFQTFLREVAVGWIENGGAVAVATGPEMADASGEWPSGVERLNLPNFREGSLAGFVRASIALRKVVAAWDPAIVHSHFLLAGLIASFARPWFGREARSWVATLHGMHATVATELRSRVMGMAELWAARRMSTVCVLNQEDGYVLSRYIAGDRIRVLPGYGLGCDLHACESGAVGELKRRAVRKRLSIPASSFVVAYVGRRTEFKGFAVAVRGYLAAGLPNSRLLLIGAADSVHSSGLSLNEAETLRRDRRVIDLGWQTNVPELLNASDVCLLPSSREGMPVTLMESLAVGTPVVTASTRGCRDVVRADLDGVILKEENSEAIARVLVSLDGDRQRLELLSRQAYLGRGRFDRACFVKRELEFYESLLAARPH